MILVPTMDHRTQTLLFEMAVLLGDRGTRRHSRPCRLLSSSRQAVLQYLASLQVGQQTNGVC